MGLSPLWNQHLQHYQVGLFLLMRFYMSRCIYWVCLESYGVPLMHHENDSAAFMTLQLKQNLNRNIHCYWRNI